MKEVKFVEVKSEINGYGFGKGMVYEFINIEEVVKEHIENGWDYCGYLPKETRGTGDLEKISLIFTK